MWCGDWSQFPQESLRLLNSKVETKSYLEEAKSLLFTLGNAEDGDNHVVRVACLGPYLFASTYFSKDCEIWARSCGIFYHPSKLSDNSLTPEIREVILVLDTLAYHVCLLLVVSCDGANKCHIGGRLESKHQNFLKDFDKEVVYSKVVALVEPSEFFKAFRKKLRTTTLKDEQILGCFMIALKASIAHCSGVLDTMLTYIVKDSMDNDKSTEGNQLKVSGNKKFKEGAHLEAHTLYTKAISKVRFNHLLYSNRALCSLQLSRYREVELDARRAIILSPNFEKGYYKMAQVYENQKQLGQAKQVMEYYVKRCNLLVVNVSTEVKDFYEKLGKAAEQTRNGKTEPKSTQAAPTKTKKKPVLDLLSDSDSEDIKPAKPASFYKSNIPQATLIKKASEDLLAGLFKSALQGYKEVLAAKPTMAEQELVILKYAAGHAAANLDSLEDLNEAEKLFFDITANHKDIIFPLAYYGLSLVNKRMNRFSDALPYLEKGLSILSKGIRFIETVLWPGTKTKIDIAERTKLQRSLEEMQAECRSPPERDAMCCREDCPLQKNIYYSDPDFRGFQQLHCRSKCLVQYHPACWKETRDDRDLTEKGFLGTLCPTPDCNDVIIKVETIEKDGTVGRQFVHSDFEKETAPKQKKTKKEKKQELREMKKKQKRGDTAVPTKQPSLEEDDATSVVSTGCDSVGSAFQDETAATAPPAAPSDAARAAKAQTKVPPAASTGPDAPKNEAATNHPSVPPLHDAQYLLKREEEDEDEVVDVRPKKWKRRRPKKVVTLELGSNDHLYSEYQERILKLAQYKNIIEDHGDWKTFCQKKKEMLPGLDPEAPFFIPEALRNNEAALEAVLQHRVGFRDLEDSNVRENIYLYLQDLIQSHGPMSVHDPLLLDEVANFPPVARSLIDEAGGLQRFLMHSMRFFFINDTTVQTYGTWTAPEDTSQDEDSPEYLDEEDYDQDEWEYEAEEEEQDGGWRSTPAEAVAPAPVVVEQPRASNLNPNARDFGVQSPPAPDVAGSGDCRAEPQAERAAAALPQEVATATVGMGDKGAGRELVVRQLLAELAPRQLAQCLADALQAFKGPLSAKMLNKVNKKLEFHRLSNKSMMRDYFVQVNLTPSASEEHEVDVKMCQELKLENERLAEKLATALDQNVQLQRKHTLEASQSKEKLEEVSKELQVTKQTLKKTKLESETELKKLQQEKMKLKEEIRLLKSSRDDSDMKGTLEKTITEVAKLRSENGDLMENCKTFQEAADGAIDRARLAEVRILETALEWAKERYDRSTKPVEKALHDLDRLISLPSDPMYTAELTKMKGLAEKYRMEWSHTHNEFERKVKLHVEKVKAGETLASLPVLNLPSRPDFNIRIPAPPPPPFMMRQPGFYPPPPPPMASFAPQGHMSRPRLPTHRPPPGVVPPAAPLISIPKVYIPNGAIPKATADQAFQPPSGPPPGLGRFPGMNDPSSSVNSSRGSSPASEGHPTTAAAGAQTASRFDKADASVVSETHRARSDKLFAKLSSKYPNHSGDEIKTALQKVYKEHNGFKGMTIAEIVRATSEVIQGNSAAASSAAATRSWAPAGPAANGLEAMRWNGTNSQCSICLEDLDGTSKQMQTSCGHTFHEHCLEKWYKTDQSCPNCRTPSLSDKDFPSLGK